MNLALLTDWPRCLHFDTLDSYISAVYLALGLHAISQRMSDECKEKGTWPTEAVDRWHTSCLKAKEKKKCIQQLLFFCLSRNVVSLYPHSYLDSLYKRRLTAGHGVAPTQIDVKCWRTCWVVCVEGKDGIVVYFTHIFFFFFARSRTEMVKVLWKGHFTDTHHYPPAVPAHSGELFLRVCCGFNMT